MRREVERAVSKGLHVLPFRIENVPLSKSLEYFISTQHWLDAIGGDLDTHLRELCECMELLLRRRVDDAAPPTPVAARAPALAPALQEHLRVALAQFIGPIAGHIVRCTAVPGRTAQQVVDALALELDDGAERKQFIGRCNATLGSVSHT